MKLYGAIDLHSTNNVTVVINEQDQVVYQKCLPNDLSLIAQQLSSYRRSLQGIVVESTYNWYWLVDGLMEKAKTGTSTNEGSVSSTHCVSPLLFQTARDTKLLPVVQLRSGVILLMGDPRGRQDISVTLVTANRRHSNSLANARFGKLSQMH